LLVIPVLLVVFIIIKEIVQLYSIFKMKNNKTLLCYIPVFGPFMWNAIFRSNKKDSWLWLKTALREAEAKKLDLIIFNEMFGFKPNFMPVSSSLLRAFYKDEVNHFSKENIVNAPLFELGIFLKSEPKHIAMRGVFSDIFEASNLRKVGTNVQDIARRRLLELSKDKSTAVDLKPALSNIFLDILDEVLFGCTDVQVRGMKLSNAIIQFFKDVLGFTSSFYAIISFGNAINWTFLPQVKALTEFREEISNVILKRYGEHISSGKPDNSFLGNMAKFNMANPDRIISNQDLVGNAILFVFAAYDTTRHATAWGFHHIAKDKVLQERLRKELAHLDISKDDDFEQFDNNPLLESLIKEILRIGAPLMSTGTRVIVKDCTIDGFNFKKGEMVSFPTGVSGFKEDFQDPFTFKPDRFLPGKPKFDRMSFLPFSHGKRACIGQYLAKMNMKVIIIEGIRQYSFSHDDAFEVESGEFPFAAMKSCHVKIAPHC